MGMDSVELIMQIEKEYVAIIQNQLQIDIEEIVPSARFAEDLGVA